MKRCLVTGASGFIGMQIVKALKERGYYITALINGFNEEKIRLLHMIDENIEVLFDEKFLMMQEHESFDVIYHLATVGVRPDFTDINKICDVNIKMGCRLVDFAKANNTKLIVNFGSCFEYGNHNGEVVSEEMDCYPESLYAISKNSATMLMTQYSKMNNINMITVRPFGVFGEGESANRLAPSIINKCLKGERIETTAGEQIRDFVNVKDVARSVVLLSESSYEPYQIYNICSDNPVSVKDFIKEIVEVCGFDLNLIQFGKLPYRKNEAMVFAGKNDKLMSTIDYKFPKDHKAGILDLYKSIMENKV